MPTFTPFISACLAILFLGGCSTGFYKKRADKGVYEILKKVENDIFGESSNFSIDTPTSGKKTKDITALKLLKSRNKGGKITLSLDQALGYAIKNSREYQSEKEKLYLTALASKTQHILIIQQGGGFSVFFVYLAVKNTL